MLGILGSHPARQAGSATGRGSYWKLLLGWGRVLGGWRFFPGGAKLPGTALGGRELQEPARCAA